MHRDPFLVLALLGTERLGAPPPAPHPVLADAWAALDWSRREEAALRAMALVAVARGAGAVPLAGVAEAEVAPPERLAPCPPRAAPLLRRMLAGEHAEFLPEWLAGAARRGWRTPFRDLPALLELAARHAALRASVAPVLGSRGEWLARQTEEWGAVLEAARVGEEAWETGAPAERVAWLRQTRTADPARAATALAAAWPQMAGEERERLLAVVAEAPTAHDVGLLEGEALRDRRREVRTAARAALPQRPESAFAARARQRLAAMVKIEGLLLGRRLVLTPPETFDPAWKADGVEEKAPAGVGPRAFWARQLLAATPLSAWIEQWRMDAAKLFSLKRDEDWGDVILLGWMDAALAAPEAAHAEALALHLIELKPWPKGAPAPVAVLSRLLSVLDAEAVARVLAACAAQTEDALYFELLFRGDFALTPEAARRALALCVPALQAKPYPRLQSNHARALAVRLPADLIGESLARLAALPEPSSPTEELMRALEFRQQLQLALSPAP